MNLEFTKDWGFDNLFKYNKRKELIKFPAYKKYNLALLLL